ncbi:MAG: TRAP transporter substrate-binding protein [Clostridia bacterium]|jgi:TRAP-type C4-dicarboxylate transport system substrate-binding protein|nr:TRAP transporter substrate-binding protein [Clostridia bacterium]MDH7573118.1 TRAP transporter substrate-binding protein [Clostridia bacterium]
MRGKTWLILVAVLVISVPVLSACGSQPAQQQPSGQAATQEPIKLLFATFESENAGFMVEAVKAFGRDLEQKTNGKVKVEYSYAQALGKIQEYYDLVARGVCDAAFCAPFMVPGVFPLAEMTTLPFKLPSAEIATQAMYEVYKKGYLDEAYNKGVKLLFIAAGQGDPLTTTKKPVRTLQDFKGLKIKVSGGQQNPRVEAMGGVPVFISGAEVYLALERGTVDGQMAGYAPFPQFKWCELTRYATEPGMGAGNWAFFMNEASYNKLPEDVRQVIDEMAANNEYGLIGAKNLDRMAAAGKQCLIDHGAQIIKWEPAALQELSEKNKAVWEKWISEREAKGLPAKKALDEMYRALKQLGVDDPAYGYIPQG